MQIDEPIEQKERRKEGFEAGKKWGEDADLRNLDAINDSLLDTLLPNNFPIDAICKTIDETDFEEFWDKICGKNWRTKVDGYFMHGFVRGTAYEWHFQQYADEDSCDEDPTSHDGRP